MKGGRVLVARLFQHWCRSSNELVDSCLFYDSFEFSSSKKKSGEIGQILAEMAIKEALSCKLGMEGFCS